MDFEFDSDQHALRDSIRRYMKNIVTPVVQQCEQEKRVPLNVLAGLAQFGYIGGQLPEADGGFALDPITWGLMMEEAGYCWGSLRTMLNITNIALRLLSTHGTSAQKEKYLVNV